MNIFAHVRQCAALRSAVQYTMSRIQVKRGAQSFLVLGSLGLILRLNLKKIFKYYYFFICFTMYSACSRVDRGSLMLRYSAIYSPLNSGGIACWVALCVNTHTHYIFNFLEWKSNPQPAAFKVTLYAPAPWCCCNNLYSYMTEHVTSINLIEPFNVLLRSSRIGILVML